MATIINKSDKVEKLSPELQKEVVRRCNEAYDHGGADTLKLVLDTANTLAAETPELRSYAKFVSVLVEGIRAQLRDNVEAAQSDAPVEEKSKIISV